MREVIAYPGVEGSFSCAAAQAMFPESERLGFETFEETARAVVDGRASYGLLPVENSYAGAVLATYGLLERLPLYIVGETFRAVRHQLLGLPGATVEGLREISSHPQAIAQCSEFLATLPRVRILPSANTALSARDVAEQGDPSRAAIASLEAAKAFGLTVLRGDIQTAANNTTRFLIVSPYFLPLGTPGKATVVFKVNNEVGALAKALTSFAESGLNMTRIESRPLPETPFYYFFSADFEGAMDREHLQRAMVAVRPFTSEVKLLGAYPKGSLPGGRCGDAGAAGTC